MTHVYGKRLINAVRYTTPDEASSDMTPNMDYSSRNPYGNVVEAAVTADEREVKQARPRRTLGGVASASSVG